MTVNCSHLKNAPVILQLPILWFSANDWKRFYWKTRPWCQSVAGQRYGSRNHCSSLCSVQKASYCCCFLINISKNIEKYYPSMHLSSSDAWFPTARMPLAPPIMHRFSALLPLLTLTQVTLTCLGANATYTNIRSRGCVTPARSITHHKQSAADGFTTKASWKTPSYQRWDDRIDDWVDCAFPSCL